MKKKYSGASKVHSNFDVGRPEEKRKQSYVSCDRCFCRGVYFLHRKGQVVYVGMSSVNCMKRVLSHYDDGKEFDSFSIRVLDNLSDFQLKEHEKVLIKKFKPEYNVVHNSLWDDKWNVV